MSYDEFWYKEPKLVKAYRDAEEYRKERVNYELWLQGLYIQRAFNSGLDALAIGLSGKNGRKPMQYLEYPIAITKREKEAETERNKQRTIRWFMSGGKNGNNPIR